MWVEGAVLGVVMKAAFFDQLGIPEPDVDLGVGNGEATAFGCDLTEGYIEENAAYYSS